MAGVAGATQDGATDDEIVKSAAAQGVEVVRAHRKIIGQTMALAERLLQYAVSEEIEGKTHADIFRSISQGLAKVVPLERQAFSLDKDFGEQLGDGLKAGMTSFPPEPETVGQWIDLCKRMDAAVAGGAKK